MTMPPLDQPMSEAQIERWLNTRRAKKPLARNYSMLDGFLTAMAAGPLDLNIMALICAAVGVGPSAFTQGRHTSLIMAVANRFNLIGAALQGNGLNPHYRLGANGDIDARDWCQGFMAAVNLNRDEWRAVLDLDSHLYGLMLPVLIHCVDAHGRPILGPPRAGPETEAFFKQAYTDIPVCVGGIRNHYHVRHYNNAEGLRLVK
jgi:uncharacterized protein